MKMKKINWNNKEKADYIEYFDSGEFPESPDIYAEPRLILNLNEYRKILKSRVHPSPVSGALARFDDKAEDSEHYAVDRKSKAVDVFPEGSILRAWTVAVTSGLWTGVGVYFDTEFRYKKWCMLHLDNRKESLIWYRLNKKDYYYPLYSGTHLRKLFQLLLVQNKQ